MPEKEGKLRPAAMIVVVEPVTGFRNTLSMIPRRSEMDRSQRHRKGDHGHRSQISPRGNNHRGWREREIQKSIVNRALRHQISVYLGPSTRSDLLPITLWHKSLSFFSSHSPLPRSPRFILSFTTFVREQKDSGKARAKCDSTDPRFPRNFFVGHYIREHQHGLWPGVWNVLRQCGDKCQQWHSFAVVLLLLLSALLLLHVTRLSLRSSICRARILSRV